jgi:transcriptional regulator with XRE-family HTH domain
MNYPTIVPNEPVRFRFAITTWGMALMRCRVAVDLSHRDVSERVGVSRGLVKAWERNEGVPTAQQLKRLYGSVPQLRAYENLLPNDTQTDVEVERAADQGVAPGQTLAEAPPPVLNDLDQPRTFQDALRLARQVEGLLQEEVGELIGVHQSTISSWERGDVLPVQDHYDLLVDLFEVLRGAPKPRGLRDMEKPGRNPGEPYAAPSSSRPAADAPPRTTTIPILPVAPPLPRPVPAVAADLSGLDAAGVEYARALAELAQRKARLQAHRARVGELEAAIEETERRVETARGRLHAAAGAVK